MLSKRHLICCVCAFNMLVLNAQTFFSEQEEHMIFYSPDIANTAVCVGDLQGDGSPDILSFFNKKFRLYTPSEGIGTFKEMEIISDVDDWVLAVQIKDLNGDGKLDILAASYNFNKIIWYENVGDLTFNSPKTISTNANGARSVYAADLDNDGDEDVISASMWDDKIAWYANQGDGIFSEEQIITTNAEGARYVYVSDLNNDGYQDVISASVYDNKIAWYENQGGSTFSEQHIITGSAARAVCVYTADMDGDNIPDVLSASSWDNKIAWYKNDGLGNFGDQQVISTSVDRAEYVYAADMDNDGDPDVLSASFLDNKLAWYENKGAGDFGPQQIVTEDADGPGFIYATDIDGDGYNDIISASTDFKIAWYENTLPMNILSNPEDTLVLPATDAVFGIKVSVATSYQWQCNNGADFFNLSNNDVYDGVDSDTLRIRETAYDLQGNRYRCMTINGSDSLNSTAAVLTIKDTIKPVITSVHTDTILLANSSCFAEIPDFTGKVQASDNSNGKLNISQVPVPWTKVYGSSEQITLIASDFAGNSSEVKFNVILLDDSPPAFETISGFSQLKKDGEGRFILPDYTDSIGVVDNCSANSAIRMTQDPAPGSFISDSLIVVTVNITATDEAENNSEISFELVTMDVKPPVITSVHNDVIVEGLIQCAAYLPDFTDEVEAQDNIDNFSDLIITQVPEPNTIIYGKENQVTLSVEDRAGNAAEVTFNVEVSNDIIINCIPDQILNLEEGQTSYTVSGFEFDPVSLEFYCEFGSLWNNINDSSSLDQVEFTQDTTQVLWTLTDQAGNMAQCSFNVILVKALGIETFHQYGISVYPNPVKDELTIESDELVIKLEVLDMTGKLLYEYNPVSSPGCIDMSDFIRGSYILRIYTDNKVFKMIFLKE